MKPLGKIEEVKKFGKIMVIALGFGLLAVALSSIPSRPAAASGSAPVTVVNTPLPITGSVDVSNFPATQPVSGTVNVGNLPAVQAVGGTVSVGNFPAVQPVSLTNSPLSPLFVQFVPFPRFTVSCQAPFTDLAVSCALGSVPTGDTFVIGTVSGKIETVHIPCQSTVLAPQCTVSPTLIPLDILNTDGSDTIYYFSASFMASSLDLNGFMHDFFTVNQFVSLSADGGSHMNIGVRTNNLSSGGSITFAASGYLTKP